MINWTLATRDGFYAIHGDTMEDEVITGQPLLIDPSITFRKHFEIPQNIDRNPDKLKLELFSRFLPSDIEDYICQFQDGPLTEDGTRSVLGLAIKDQDMKWLEGLHGEESENYFLENLLRPPGGSEERHSLELPLPGGLYFGVFRDRRLVWARYLNDPRSETIYKTRDYLEEEYPDLDQHHSLPSFPEETEDPTNWIEGIGEWLPDSPDTDKIVVRDKERSPWDTWRQTAWTLLFLTAVTVGLWVYYNRVLINRHQKWLNNKSKKLLESSNNPVRTLQSRIKSTRQKLKTQSTEVLDIHPRIYQLDQAIAANDVLLLQMQLVKNRGQLVLGTDSLQSAEQMKGSLLSVSNIERVEIVSTNPQQDQQYQYKVSLNVQWSSES
ncbi:MAG: hypothetical protein ABEK50_17760 [bacterium]